MEQWADRNLSSSRFLAETVLDAWLSGDRYRLLWELDRVTTIPRTAPDGAECDRMEVLAGIADEMRNDSNLFASRFANARVGVWIDLLSHLSSRSAGTN
jgi:hypothetical protein